MIGNGFQFWITLIDSCISFLGLPYQSAINWVAQITEIFCPTALALEVQNQGVSKAVSL